MPQQWTDNPNELLGVSIRHTAIKEAHDFVWHVLVSTTIRKDNKHKQTNLPRIQEVFPNSPASAAQLRPFTDYIIASDAVFFQDSEDFFHLISDNLGRPVSLRVYNSESNDIRSVCRYIRSFIALIGIHRLLLHQTSLGVAREGKRTRKTKKKTSNSFLLFLAAWDAMLAMDFYTKYQPHLLRIDHNRHQLQQRSHNLQTERWSCNLLLLSVRSQMQVFLNQLSLKRIMKSQLLN